ncbi:uncharacterized protein [Watersipora subatra]|uniref:uncharacterized protein n=1 Tax=Watersipora subatra TaxID=2589382 RepID=UPI00355C32C5
MLKLKGYVTIFFISCFIIGGSNADSYGQQSNIEFSIAQAQSLWDDKEILGDSIYFEHPVSLGTFTNCDDIEISNAFTDEYNFKVNYTTENRRYQLSWVRVVQRAAYRDAQAQRTIENGVVLAEGCVMACITEKDFVCRDCDFFVADGGKCALYETTGLLFNDDPTTTHPLYVGDNPASVHYTIYKREEFPIPCNVTNGEYAHPYFALGWKAMETGWYTLAKSMFNNATSIDPEFYLAYVGKMLANDDMGYGMNDENGVSYKTHMNEILVAPDFEVKLSLQEQLLVQALAAFQNGETLAEGLEAMIQVFIDYQGYKDNILKVIEGNANLLKRNTYQLLSDLAETDENVFALHLLTHNLNPYTIEKNRISGESQRAAIKAAYIYQGLGIQGAWPIIADCTDINAYYAQWQFGRLLLENQKNFLFRNTHPDDREFLFRDDDDDYIIVNGLEEMYTSKALLRIDEYERLHFFELQLALFDVADSRLYETMLMRDEEVWTMTRLRMIANAYFSTYDYIYSPYADKLKFDEDWSRALNESTNDLALVSRAFYWTAAAVQRIRNSLSVGEIKDALKRARTALSRENDDYDVLLSLYQDVVKGTEELIQAKYDEAKTTANNAKILQDALNEANFELAGVEDSKYFRMLVPLGYQFQADTLNSMIGIEDSTLQLKTAPVTDTEVVESYGRAIRTPPLNTSRVLYGFATSLFRRDKDNPKRIGEDYPAYVVAFKSLEDTWKNAEVEGTFGPRNTALSSKEYYFNLPESGCSAINFQIISKGDGKLCWGGYVIIGVSVGLVVIIVIIIGILFLRKKAKAPTRDKEKEGGFMFSGPNLTRRDSNESSSHLGLDTLNRGSVDATPYASQTLSIQRPFHDVDYTQRSNTIGGVGMPGDFEAHSSH